MAYYTAIQVGCFGVQKIVSFYVNIFLTAFGYSLKILDQRSRQNYKRLQSQLEHVSKTNCQIVLKNCLSCSFLLNFTLKGQRMWHKQSNNSGLFARVGFECLDRLFPLSISIIAGQRACHKPAGRLIFCLRGSMRCYCQVSQYKKHHRNANSHKLQGKVITKMHNHSYLNSCF